LVELGGLLAATRAVENENETATDLAYLRGRGTSLGGMRPKYTVMDDDGRFLHVNHGQWNLDHG
jgi:serine/threonine-protein kinase HipA